MKKTYKITDNGLEESDPRDSVFSIYADPSDKDRQKFIDELDLPQD